MKYTVKIDEKIFEVEIEDINARPVIARVDGEAFEVSPMSGIQPQGGTVSPGLEMAPATGKLPATSHPVSLASSTQPLTAPLPGTVTEVFVKPGEMIDAGNVVLVIEAMKMKNSIRATRGGLIDQVLVSAGQTVAHKQALITFKDVP